ncbi:MAG TPA: MFS transporter [Candidatus Limnocylindria bacterium]
MTVLAPAGWWRGLAGLTRSGRASEGLAWSLYDFANTIFSYGVVSYAIGLWSVDRLGPGAGQFWLGVAAAVSVGLNAAVSPVLGAVSDRSGRRLPFLLFFTALTILCTAAIALVSTGDELPLLTVIGLGLFAVANFSYQAALIYYDATLPEVARPGALGRMSGIGVAMGYLGTVLIAVLILVLGSGSGPLTFAMVAVLFAVFAAPIFTSVREPEGGGRFRLGEAARSWAQVATTLRHAREVPGLLRFLVGRFFYTDPVNTAIVVMAVFATEAIGLTKSEANLMLLLLTVVAVVASFLWGRAVEAWGPKRTLMVVLGSWCVGLVVVGTSLTVPAFVIGGVLLGSGLGGVWTSDRVYMLRLSPPGQVGEFFGLYGLVGKLSAVIGPLAYGIIVAALLGPIGRAAYQVAILSLLVLMVIGLVIIRRVPSGKPAAAGVVAHPVEPAIVPPGETPA